jgi:ubiquinone biosynthesis protein UbiJ
MFILDSIEKVITEHGSAAILSQQLAFARDQFNALERKVTELQIQVGRLEAQCKRSTIRVYSGLAGM